VGGKSWASLLLPSLILTSSPCHSTYLGPQKEGHPPWEELQWLQQLPGPPESVGPVGEKDGMTGLTQTDFQTLCSVWAGSLSGLS
jgi:hypothetical protein